MRIFKSIKWRLQVWYGLFLGITIAAGIGTSYQMERDRLFSGVDKQLHVQFQNLMSVMHSRSPVYPDLPPEMQPPGDRPPGFHFPKEAVAEFFQDSATVGYYFAIWRPDGKELTRSTNAPSDLTMPDNNSWRPSSPGLPDGGVEVHESLRKRGDNYEFIVSPRGERDYFEILVGHSILPELHELRQYLIHQIISGLIILFSALASGTFLIYHAIKPIEQISSTAVKISTGDLSQRINVAETESELGKLVAVLNSTFARLESAFAQQKQFASAAAHELRTPVSVILTQTQTALSRERTAADYQQTVEVCQRAAQRMKKLISSLLELTRLDAGQEILKRLRFDFAKTVSDSVELVKPMAAEHRVQIFLELAPLEITGDSERLAQVVTNLLTNAIQYNYENGEVTLQSKSQDGFAVLTIANTGAGIPPEDLPHIFERFYRADKSRTGAGNAGLGLAIAKAIVEAHSGTIEVASEEMNRTTFTLRLPL